MRERFRTAVEDEVRVPEAIMRAERVTYPGLDAHETEQDRHASGIPYHREVLPWRAGVLPEPGIENRLPPA